MNRSSVDNTEGTFDEVVMMKPIRCIFGRMFKEAISGKRHLEVALICDTHCLRHWRITELNLIAVVVICSTQLDSLSIQLALAAAIDTVGRFSIVANPLPAVVLAIDQHQYRRDDLFDRNEDVVLAKAVPRGGLQEIRSDSSRACSKASRVSNYFSPAHWISQLVQLTDRIHPYSIACIEVASNRSR